MQNENTLKFTNNTISNNAKDNINNDESKYIKAKTLFADKKKNSKNHTNKITNVLIEEPIFIDENDEEIKRVKSWASDNNNIIIEKHLIEEQERIFNNRDSLAVDIKNDRMSVNLEELNKVNKISNITFKNKNASNVNRANKREATRIKFKERSIKDNKYAYNNNNHYSNNSSKDDDEENSSFMTKDKLEEFIKQSYNINNHFIRVLFILFVLTVIIITIKLIFAKTNFSLTSYLTNGMIFIQEIKADIYTGSIIALSQCYRNTPEEMPQPGLAEFYIQLYAKSTDLMNHLNAFEKQLKLTQNNDLFYNIMTYLYKNITITNLNADWSYREEESYLLKEVNYFSYLLNKEAFQDPKLLKCDFENNFYLTFYNTSEEIYNLNDKKETSFNQRMISYIINNVIYKISPLLNDIVEEIVIVQVKTMDNYLTKVIIISTISIFIIIINTICILNL